MQSKYPKPVGWKEKKKMTWFTYEKPQETGSFHRRRDKNWQSQGREGKSLSYILNLETSQMPWYQHLLFSFSPLPSPPHHTLNIFLFSPPTNYTDSSKLMWANIGQHQPLWENCSHYMEGYNPESFLHFKWRLYLHSGVDWDRIQFIT